MSGSGRDSRPGTEGPVVDVLTAIRTAWRSLPGRDPVAAPARAPETPIERLIADTLAARPLPGAPSCRVSRSFSTAQHSGYRVALAHDGWVADLGMLWARAFVRALDAARGVLWELETAA